MIVQSQEVCVPDGVNGRALLTRGGGECAQQQVRYLTGVFQVRLVRHAGQLTVAAAGQRIKPGAIGGGWRPGR